MLDHISQVALFVTLIPHKKCCPPRCNLPPHPPNSHSHYPLPPLLCLTATSLCITGTRVTMNTFEFYSNTNTDDVQDYVASAPWPDSPWATGDSYTSVPQSTHPDLISNPGYLSTADPFVPELNATDFGAFTLAPTTEMGMFTNLQTTQLDYPYQVSNQHV